MVAFPSVPFASSFLTGGVLSWAIPIATLLAVVVWWSVILVRRAFEADRSRR